MRNGVGSTGSAPPVNMTSAACVSPQPAIGRMVRSACVGVVMIAYREPVETYSLCMGAGGTSIPPGPHLAARQTKRPRRGGAFRAGGTCAPRAVSVERVDRPVLGLRQEEQRDEEAHRGDDDRIPKARVGVAGRRDDGEHGRRQEAAE